MRIKTFLIRFCFLYSVCCLLFISSCSKEKQKEPPKGMTAPVTAASAIKKTVPVQLHAIGNVEAYSTVEIKARAGGELMSVNFREGQDVNKGDLLFTIDPRPYRTALEAAQANLAKDTALSKKADNDVVRYTELSRDQLVSRDDYEKILANAEALRATLEADRSAVENAGLQLSYCSVYAPVSGRTGSLLANQGNLIKANDDKPMVVINQVQPVYAAFSVPEQNLADIKKYTAGGKLRVEAFTSNEDRNAEEGVLTFIDNTVDTATGTIKLKATFSNKDKRLWPGQFVNISITLASYSDAVVVPSQAVQTGQKGQYIFIVKDDLTVESRPVEVKMMINGETVISSGLQSGEKVVTDGHLRLVPGAKVEIKK
ncbi:MAG: efflux RND transporter periplasmic adaptor subunit [Nitrospirae bacterium]|nr:efflux RND transporter periplasmic adaptor subunit [Nitrospirota bacterium]